MKASSPQEPIELPPTLDFLRRLWGLNHALEQLSLRMEKRLEITAQQRLLVRCIGHCPGITSSQLSELLHLDPGTISTSLKRLEAKGLILRKRDSRDKRRIFLTLSAKGSRLDHPTAGTVESAVALLLEQSDPSQIVETKALLHRFTQILEYTLNE